MPISPAIGRAKSQVFVALALVNNPELAFLDELNTGMDLQARRATWEQARKIREQATGGSLTRHFMEQLERLCDRVAIMDHGKIIALHTPLESIDSLGAESRAVFEVKGRLIEEHSVHFQPSLALSESGSKWWSMETRTIWSQGPLVPWRQGASASGIRALSSRLWKTCSWL